MANDRDYNQEEGLRGEPAREGDRREPSEQGERREQGEQGERGERDIRTSDRGVERSDWTDAATGSDAAQQSEERLADPDGLDEED